MTVDQASRVFKQRDEMVKKCEEVRVAGRAQVAASEQKIVEGAKTIEKGQALKSESERVFRNASKSTTLDQAIAVWICTGERRTPGRRASPEATVE
ncbi:MAG: hypothetical protein R3E87_08070 [Burkholderiaceae bacterium]